MPIASELGLAARRLRSAPLYTAAVVLTLAVVVAANAAAFALVHAVLLGPTAMAAPEDLVVVWEAAPSRDLPVVEISHGSALRWTRGLTSLTSTATIGSSLWPAVLRGRGDPVRMGLAAVSGEFFGTLGTAAQRGRTLAPADDVPHGSPVMVLSHGAWLRHFGGDPAAIGTTVDIDGPRTIVGVMPREFDVPRGADGWIPVAPALAAARAPDLDPFEHIGVLFIVGRLAPGANIAQASAELEARARADDGGTGRRFGERVVATPLLDHLLGPVRQALRAAVAAAVVLLVIACANVSGLMIARATLLSHDIAVRTALGATPGRLRRQWYVEALLVSVPGALAGVCVTWVMLGLALALAPDDIPRLGSATMGWRVVAVTSVGMLAAALACSVAPARLASRGAVPYATGASPRTTEHRGSRRTRSAFVSAQVALAVVLLGAAGLVARSFAALHRLDLGFDPAGVTTVHVGAPTNGWMQHLLERVRSSEHVLAAGAIQLRPLELGPIGQEAPVVLEGQVDTPRVRRENPTLNHQVASAGYFEAMRTPVLDGRSFTDADTATSLPVVIVGRTTARRLWPGRRAVGQRLVLPTSGGREPTWRTVVGVVADVHYRGLGDVRLDVYQPALQAAATASYLVVRTPAAALPVAALVRSDVARLDPSVAVDGVLTLDAAVDRARAPWRFATWVLGFFALAGVGLASVGLFTVVALDVTGRRRDLAIHAALGARPARLLQLALAPAGRQAGLGIALGALVAIGAIRFTRALLFGIDGTDPWTWAAVLAIVLAAIFTGAYLPARRILRRPLASLLRDE